MLEIYSEIRTTELDTMYVASAIAISANPEEEVITFLKTWAKENGIDSKSRQFGFDYPVSEEQQSNNLRGYEYWVTVPENTPGCEKVTIKKIEKSKYAVLRITDPFSDPFTKIPNGWRKLVEQFNHYQSTYNKNGYCLEEIVEENGITYMDIFLPIE